MRRASLDGDEARVEMRHVRAPSVDESDMAPDLGRERNRDPLIDGPEQHAPVLDAMADRKTLIRPREAHRLRGHLIEIAGDDAPMRIGETGRRGPGAPLKVEQEFPQVSFTDTDPSRERLPVLVPDRNERRSCPRCRPRHGSRAQYASRSRISRM